MKTVASGTTVWVLREPVAGWSNQSMKWRKTRKDHIVMAMYSDGYTLRASLCPCEPGMVSTAITWKRIAITIKALSIRMVKEKLKPQRDEPDWP